MTSESSQSGWWSVLVDFFSGGKSAAGQSVNPTTAMRTSAVYCCVRILSESMACLPFHIYEKLGRNRKRFAESHPLAEVFNSPNPWQSSFDFIENQMVALCLRGNAYAEIVPGPLGSVSELIPLHPDTLRRCEFSPSGELMYTFADANGETRTIRQRDILHTRGISENGFFGLSPIGAAREEIGSNIAMGKYAGSFFSRSSRPSGVLVSDGNIKEEHSINIKEEWQKFNSGEKNWHNVAVLQGGLKWVPISVNNHDSQFIESRRFGVEEIARIFRVPLHMLNSLERATFSNIEHQSIEFVKYSLVPWVRRFECAINRALIMDYPKHYCKFEIEGLLRGDSKARAEYYNSMVTGGLMTPNECRELEDLDPIPGADKLIVQGAMIPLDKLGEQQSNNERGNT